MLKIFGRTPTKTALIVSLSSMIVSAALAGSRDIEVTPEQEPIYRIEAPKSDLKVSAWVDRADDSYRTGENVKLFVRANKDAYITVLDVGTSGKVHVIFPNKYQKDNHVLAHQVVQIPGPDDRFRFKIGGPTGTELIKVFATTKRKALIREDQMASVGPFARVTGSSQSIARDITIQIDVPPEGNDDADSATMPPITRTKKQKPKPGVATFNKVLHILERRSQIKPQSGAEPTPEDYFRLAESHFYGDAGNTDFHRALTAYRNAAAKGHVQAMLRIGMIFEKGMDVDRDTGAAMRWYDKAARLGNAQAMVKLARLYGKGLGVPKDYAAAIKWLRKAAATGDGIAMVNLSRMYDEGVGVDSDEREAARYLLNALKAGAWTVQENITRYTLATRITVQRALKQAGHYDGEIDGKVGPETRAALANYARAG